jgi:hypothetical protein
MQIGHKPRVVSLPDYNGRFVDIGKQIHRGSLDMEDMMALGKIVPNSTYNVKMQGAREFLSDTNRHDTIDCEGYLVRDVVDAEKEIVIHAGSNVTVVDQDCYGYVQVECNMDTVWTTSNAVARKVSKTEFTNIRCHRTTLIVSTTLYLIH